MPVDDSLYYVLGQDELPESTLYIGFLLGESSVALSPTAPDAEEEKPVRRTPPRLPVGNHDIDLLRPENLKPTHVMPRIAALATDLFREQLIVLGEQLPAPHSRRGTRPSISEKERRALVLALRMAISAVGRKIEKPVSWRVHPRGPFMRRVAVSDWQDFFPKVVFEVRLSRCVRAVVRGRA
jgi:hypothetical protein